MPTQPWKAADAEALDKRTLADWINKLSASPLCKSALHTMMMADNGVVTEWQSYLGNLAMVKGGGLEKVLDGIRGLSLQGRQPAARDEVRGRDRRAAHPDPHAGAIDRDDRQAGARVTLGNGKVLEAEHVLLTAPPSVWNKIAIDPVLPAALAPQMGTNIKYLMSLKSPVWRRTELAPELLSDGPVSMTWHATDGQKGAGEALMAFSGGPSADACREWTATQRDRNYLAELNKVYRGITASFVRARFMDWPSDPVDEGLVLVPGAGTGHRAGTDAATTASAGCTSPASTPATRSSASWRARFNSGAAVAKRIAEKDGSGQEDRGVDKSQAPNPKSQRTPNAQLPNIVGGRLVGSCDWELIWDVGIWECVGIWSLGLGI